MSVKVIDETVIQDKDAYRNVQSLVSEIKRLHTLINETEETIDQKKKEIKKISTDIFFKSIDEPEIPEFNSSHEFHTPEGVIRVSYKVKARPLTEINGKPAEEITDTLFKEHAEKLFSKESEYTVKSDDNTQRKQACEHPEVFRITLKDLTVEQLSKLIIEHPEYLTVNITNLEKYAEIYPEHVDKTTTIKINNGFLDTVDKIDGILKVKARKFIVALLKPTLEPAVVCGNKSKK